MEEVAVVVATLVLVAVVATMTTAITAAEILHIFAFRVPTVTKGVDSCVSNNILYIIYISIRIATEQETIIKQQQMINLANKNHEYHVNYMTLRALETLN